MLETKAQIGFQFTEELKDKLIEREDKEERKRKTDRHVLV